MFNSLESIYEEFGLQKSLSKSRLRAELKRRIASIHADKTGGEFPNDAVKQLYLRMQDALEFLDRPRPANALVTSNSPGNALEARVAALENSKIHNDPPIEDSARRTSEDAGRRYHGTWISSGVFAALFSAILTFSKKLTESPMFSPMVSVFWVQTIAAGALVLSGIGMVGARIRELKLKRKVAALLSDDGIAWVLRQSINNYSQEPDCAFTLRKMMDEIAKCGMKWHKSKVVRWLQAQFGSGVPRDLAEKVAKLQISSLIERRIVRQEGTRGVELVYVLEAPVAKEIVEDHGAIFFEP